MTVAPAPASMTRLPEFESVPPNTVDPCAIWIMPELFTAALIVVLFVPEIVNESPEVFTVAPPNVIGPVLALHVCGAPITIESLIAWPAVPPLVTPPLPIVSWLPPMLKAEAPEPKATERTLQFPFTFGAGRVAPEKTSAAVPSLGGAPSGDQLAAVPKSLFPPPPSQV